MMPKSIAPAICLPLLFLGLGILGLAFTGCLFDDGPSTPPGTKLTDEKTNDTIWNVTGRRQGAFDLINRAQVGAAGPDSLKDLLDQSKVSVLDTPAHPNEIKFPKTWGTANGGQFTLARGFDYANATDSTAVRAFVRGSSAAVTPALAAGSVVIAKLRGSARYAVIKVTAVNEVFGAGALSDNLDNIVFDYKLTP